MPTDPAAFERTTTVARRTSGDRRLGRRGVMLFSMRRVPPVTSNEPLAPSGDAFGEPDEVVRNRPHDLAAFDHGALIAAPGPSWRAWLYGHAFRWWLGLAFLIINAWIVAGWIEFSGWLLLLGSLAGAVYLEFLLWQFLFHRYNPELRGKFRATWYSPFKVGRWSPDWKRARKGDISPANRGPDPSEFL